MIDLLLWTIGLIPLDITASPSPLGVHPPRSSGFAAAIVGGFMGLGILVLAAVWVSLKPTRRGRPRHVGR